MKRPLDPKAAAILQDRQTAYRQTFDKESAAGKAVLEDLARFCRSERSTFHPDPRIHAVLEGRREVWLRIGHHLNLSIEELGMVYGGKEEQ